ncbi:MAG: F0F1 ATP synthase subunit B [Gemmatimonadota bacterium]
MEHVAPSGASLMDPHGGVILWTVITFLLVLLILRWKVWRPVLAALDERERRIAEALAGAQLAQEEAQESLRQHQEALIEAETRASQLVSEARHAAERLHEEILLRAREEADRLLAQARRSTEAERRQAVAALRREMADLAIRVAGAVLQANLDDERNRQLADAAIARIPGGAASSEPEASQNP